MFKGVFAAVLAAVCACAPGTAKASDFYSASYTFDEPWFDIWLVDVPVSPGRYRFQVTLSGDYLDFSGYVERYVHYEYYCGGVWCGGDDGSSAVAFFARVSRNVYAMEAEILPARIEGFGDYLTVYEDDQFRNLIMGVTPGLNRTPVAWTLTVTSIPEPATWAMMIAGFGLAGAAMRRRYITAPMHELALY